MIESVYYDYEIVLFPCLYDVCLPLLVVIAFVTFEYFFAAE